MKKYEEILKKHVDTQELEQALRKLLTDRGKEQLRDDLEIVIGDWVAKVNSTLMQNWGEPLSKIFLQAFQRGSRRLLDPKGRLIKVDFVPDSHALTPLFLQQKDYIEKLGKKLSEVIWDEMKKGLEQGLDYERIVQNIMVRAKKITKARIQTIVRSELVKAHNTGLELTMKKLGVKRYLWVTQNDRQVCDICREYERRSRAQGGFDLNDPNAPRPVRDSHPNCRCALVVLTEAKK